VAELDLEAVEMAARRQALRLAAHALQQRLNAYQRPACSGSAQYHGRHEKTFESVLGPLRLERAYYHCQRCQSGSCPRDRALGLALSSLTPGVQRMTASAATVGSFEESSELLRELDGVEVSAKQVERVAEARPSWSPFGPRSCATRVLREATRRGFAEATRRNVSQRFALRDFLGE
jgi:hypothetical protein